MSIEWRNRRGAGDFLYPMEFYPSIIFWDHFVIFCFSEIIVLSFIFWDSFAIFHFLRPVRCICSFVRERETKLRHLRELTSWTERNHTDPHSDRFSFVIIQDRSRQSDLDGAGESPAQPAATDKSRPLNRLFDFHSHFCAFTQACKPQYECKPGKFECVPTINNVPD
jgi:hypothetical protein